MINLPPRVVDALKKGLYRKNWKMVVLDELEQEDFIIDNNNLIQESIKIDERMCSGDELKFGLCEGSSLEFQFFGYSNIKGRRIKVILDIQYKEADGSFAWHSLPMGFFEVDQCPRQFDTGIMKVTAYNKLRSKYLDAKANEAIIKAIPNFNADQDDGVAIGRLLELLGDGYAIEHELDLLGVDITFNSQDYSKYWYFDENGDRHYLVEATFIYRYLIEDTTRYYKMKLNGFEFTNRVKDFIPNIPDDTDVINKSPFGGEIHRSWKDLKRNANGDMHADLVTYTDRKKTQSSSLTVIDHIVYDPNNSETIESDFLEVYAFQSVELDTTLQFYKDVKYQAGKQPYQYAFWTDEELESLQETIQKSLNDGVWGYFQYVPESIEEIKISHQEALNLEDVTLRDLQSAVFELYCQCGKLDRETDLFSGVSLNHDRLFPMEKLYPQNDLFPTSQAERANASIYEKLWTDERSEKKFKDLIITYKTLGSDGNPIEKTLQRRVNSDGNVNYNMSDNWLLKNLLWTPEEVGFYADEMVKKMKDVTWISFEMWGVGLPYLETGDELEIKTKEGTAISYILTRQLTGIQNLRDAYTNGELDIF